jgi:hypothetical protein
MKTWQIPIPYKSLSDSLVDVGANARALEDPEDRAVVHALVLLAIESCPPGGVDVLTASDLLEVVKAIPPDGRRHALDVLRTKAGLPSTVEVERKAMLDSRSYVALPDSRRVPTCAADGCQTIARDPVTWQPCVVDVNRWFCAEHQSLAQPGDMEPAEQWRFARSGGIERVPPSDGIIRAPSTGAGWGP